jgi:hypothetical protein
MIERASLDDGALRRELMTIGMSERDAQRLLAFVPLAFGRVLVDKLPIRFPETVIVIERGTERESRLADEPLFTLAIDLARRGTLTRDQFSALALRSAEMRALNKALNAGSKPEDLLVSPPVVTL